MYNFDLISDIHIDFWIRPRENDSKLDIKMNQFIESILPTKQQDVLVITGDLGHYERQNKLFLQKMKEFYKHIILVSGNHDYYLVSSRIKNKYKRSSDNRLREMKKIAAEIENVHYLDGDIVEIDGIKYGGVGMWYDFKYGEVLGVKKETIYTLWWNVMNDSEMIKPMSIDLCLNKFKEEKRKLDSIVEDADVLITHVGPYFGKIENNNNITSSFYYFDGLDLLEKIENKVWCYGHTHVKQDQIFHKCRFINAPLGYPDEKENTVKKIINI